MPRFAPAPPSNRSRRSRFAGPVITGAIGLSLLLAPAAEAQQSTPVATPAASPVASPTAQNPASITDLYSYDLNAFPAAPVSVRLLRITLEPGASSPMHTHPGPEFDLVESGTLTVDSEGEADLVGADGNVTTRALSGDELKPGELVVFNAGTGMNLKNTSNENVVLVSAVFHPINQDVPATTYTNGDPAPDAFNGVSFQVLGDGIIQSFPAGGAAITLQNVEVPAGSDLPGAEGASMYSLVNGAFAFSVAGGDVQVSRTASPGLRPNAAPEQQFTLANGDAAFFPEGVADSARADQQETLSLLRLTAVPSEGETAQVAPAAITFLPSNTQAAETVATPAPGEIGIGSKVVTNTDGVNLRSEASTDADVVEQLDIDTALTVTDGPTEAGDYTWWKVEIDGTDGPTEGWLAENFISLVNAEPSNAATPSASPAASPSASPVAADFAVGDVVVTNTDNARIRAEGSIDAEAVDAFPIGTEMTVTGAPIEADEYTWYPVALVENDSITGWIAADFIEKSDTGN